MDRSYSQGVAGTVTLALMSAVVMATPSTASEVCSPWLAQATLNNLQSGQIQQIDRPADLPAPVQAALGDGRMTVAWRYQQHYLVRLATPRGVAAWAFHVSGDRAAREPAWQVPEFACFTSERVVFARQGDGAYSVSGPWRQ